MKLFQIKTRKRKLIPLHLVCRLLLEKKKSDADLTYLQSLADDLRFIMIVSRATVHAREGEMAIEVNPSAHQKCERFWDHRADVGQNADHPNLCGGCTSNLF